MANNPTQHADFCDTLAKTIAEPATGAQTRDYQNDITATQALILINVGDGEVPIRDLVQRGYYLVSSASYNIKKLVDYGYLEQVRSVHDRRSVRLRLGDPGRQVVNHLKNLDMQLMDAAAEEPELLDAMEQAIRTLRKIERVWAEFINFA